MSVLGRAMYRFYLWWSLWISGSPTVAVDVIAVGFGMGNSTVNRGVWRGLAGLGLGLTYSCAW